MKKFLSAIAVMALSVFVLASCSPDPDEGHRGDIPRKEYSFESFREIVEEGKWDVSVRFSEMTRKECEKFLEDQAGSDWICQPVMEEMDNDHFQAININYPGYMLHQERSMWWVTVMGDLPGEEYRVSLEVRGQDWHPSVEGLRYDAKFDWSSNGDGCTVSGLNDRDITDLVIPSHHEGKPVTEIADFAFHYGNKIERVTIPDTVKRIGSHVFDSDKLQSLVIPSSVEWTHPEFLSYIMHDMEITVMPGSGAYFTPGMRSRWTCSLNNQIAPGIYGGVKDDGTIRITGIDQREGEMVIPAAADDGRKVTEIGDGVMKDSACTSVTIPESVKIIGDEAFQGMKGLTSVTIPSGVESIGSRAFEGCTALSSVELNEGLKVIGNEAFQFTKLTEISLPSTVENICYGAFAGTDIGKFVIPGKVTNIGDRALSSRCLEEVVLENEGFWGYRTETGCLMLRNELIVGTPGCTIPEGTETIGSGAFLYNKIMDGEVRIPKTVTEIDKEAFYDTGDGVIIVIEEGSPLKRQYLSTEAPIVYENAWEKSFFWESVTGGVRITDFVGSEAEVTVPGKIDGKPVTEIGENAFFKAAAVTKVTLPSTVKFIYSYAFYDCDDLVSVDIGKGCQNIFDHAFDFCSGITEMELPDGLRWIGECGLRYVNVPEMRIPASLERVEKDAFDVWYADQTIIIPESIDLNNWSSDWKGNSNVKIVRE